MYLLSKSSIEILAFINETLYAFDIIGNNKHSNNLKKKNLPLQIQINEKKKTSRELHGN